MTDGSGNYAVQVKLQGSMTGDQGKKADRLGTE